MANIREKINLLKINKDDRLLMEEGIISDFGNLTDLGRRIVLDTLFSDKDLKKVVVDAVKAVRKEDKAQYQVIKPGKVTKAWLKTRANWVKNNPPNHQGYYLCGLCGKPVHYTEFELDHIEGRRGKLLSNEENLQPTHSWCNRMKGSRKVQAKVSSSEYELRRKLDLQMLIGDPSYKKVSVVGGFSVSPPEY